MNIVSVNNHINYNSYTINNQLAQKSKRNISTYTQADTVSFSANVAPKNIFNEVKGLHSSALDLLQKALEKSKKFEYNGKIFSNVSNEMHISSPIMKTPKGEECWLEYAPSKPYMKYYSGPLHISYKNDSGIIAAIRKDNKIQCIKVSPRKHIYNKTDDLDFCVYDKNSPVSSCFSIKPDETNDISIYQMGMIDSFKDVVQTFLNFINK